jgi:sorbitol-specific phosphotransferase system component IIBC
VIWAALGEWIISGLIPDIFSMIGFMLVTAGVVSVPFLTPSSKTPT